MNVLKTSTSKRNWIKIVFVYKHTEVLKRSTKAWRIGSKTLWEQRIVTVAAYFVLISYNTYLVMILIRHVTLTDDKRAWRLYKFLLL